MNGPGQGVFFFLNSVISKIWQHFLKRKIVEFTLGKQNFQVTIIIEKKDSPGGIKNMTHMVSHSVKCCT